MELKVDKVALLVEYSKMLPDFERKTGRGTRYWQSDDVAKLIEFRAKVPHGRNGILGDVTQRYTRKKKEELKNGKKDKSRINT